MTPGGPNSEMLMEKEEARREDCKLLAPETTLVSDKFIYHTTLSKLEHKRLFRVHKTLFTSSFRNPSQVQVVSPPAVVNVLHWGAPTTMTVVWK